MLDSAVERGRAHYPAMATYASRRSRLTPERDLQAWTGFSRRLMAPPARQPPTTHYAETALDVLVDSPMYCGKLYTKQVDLDPNGPVPRCGWTSWLIDQTGLEIEQQRKFSGTSQSRDAGVSASMARITTITMIFCFFAERSIGGNGLEHHRSSEDGVMGDYFSSAGIRIPSARDLLPHEYTPLVERQVSPPVRSVDTELQRVPKSRTRCCGSMRVRRSIGAMFAGGTSGLHTRQQALRRVGVNCGDSYDARRHGLAHAAGHHQRSDHPRQSPLRTGWRQLVFFPILFFFFLSRTPFSPNARLAPPLWTFSPRLFPLTIPSTTPLPLLPLNPSIHSVLPFPTPPLSPPPLSFSFFPFVLAQEFDERARVEFVESQAAAFVLPRCVELVI